jgi:NAD(P)H-dependent FMN reductase
LISSISGRILHIPPFNQDFEKEPPEKVKDFKAKIRTADAILMIILRGG